MTRAARWRVAIGVGVAASCLAATGILLVVTTSVSFDALALKEAAGSMALPWTASVDDLYPASTECAQCHPSQVEEWQSSAHARSAANPLVHAAVCGRCHTPLGTQFDAEYQLKLYDDTPMPELPTAAAAGITCVTCHAPAHVPEEQLLTFLPAWPNWRGTDLALETQAFDDALGTFGSGTVDDPAPVPNESHSSVVDARVGSSELCQPCHEVVVDKRPLAPHNGLGQSKVRLLTTYSEWADSPYQEANETCQSCHMPRHERQGTAAVAPAGTEYDPPLPVRPLADHSLLGVSSDYLTSGAHVDQQEARAAALVADAATVELRVVPPANVGDAMAVEVISTNTEAGHDLPTGFAYWSEAWLDVEATDGHGRVLFRSGDVDDEGWLRDEFNPRVVDGTVDYDAHLVSLRARLVTVGPNRARWLQPDDTISIPYDEVPRNLNGTPLIGPDGDAAERLLREIYPDLSPPIASYALQEGYILRFADTVVRNGIAAHASRVSTFPIPLDDETAWPVQISARLLMRQLWPWMLQQQEELPSPRPLPRTYVIAQSQTTVPGAP